MPDLAGTIERVKSPKGGSMARGTNSRSNPEETEINFYALPALDEKGEGCIKDHKEAIEKERKASPDKKSKGKRRKGRASLKKTGDSKKESASSARAPLGASYSIGSAALNPLFQGSTTTGSNMSHLSAQLIGYGEGPSNLTRANINEIPIPTNPIAGYPARPPLDIRNTPFVQNQVLEQHLGGSFHPTSLSNPTGFTSASATSFGSLPNPQSGNTMDMYSAKPTPSQMAELLGAGGYAGVDFGELEPTPMQPSISWQSEKFSASTGHNPPMSNDNERQAQYQQQHQSHLAQLQHQQNRQHEEQQLQMQLHIQQLQQQRFLFGDHIMEQQREQLLPSMSATEQSSSFFQQQQQHNMLPNQFQYPSALFSVVGDQQHQLDSQQDEQQRQNPTGGQQFPDQACGPRYNSWMS
jgi:hypothetical protein